MGRSGTDLAAYFATLSPDDREAAIVAAAVGRELPDFVLLETWKTINRSIVIEGKTRSLFLYVLPFLAYGTSADPLWYPCRPTSAQQIADSLGAIIMSPTLVRETFYDPNAKKIPLQIPPKLLTLTGAAHDAYMQSPDAFKAHSDLVNARIAESIASGAAKSPVDCVGHSKNVVLGPHLDGTHVAIYGGYNAAGGYTTPDGVFHPAVDGWAWQSYPGPHVVTWVDDSQLVGFVFRNGFLDGVPVDVATIFTDPVLYPLVADETPNTKASGPFVPRFPTASPGKVSTTPAPPPPVSTLPPPRKSGVPFATPTGKSWPVVTSDPKRLCVAYVGVDGSIVACDTADASAARFFMAYRGDRVHAGIDLIAHEGDPILATEDGVIIGNIPGYVGLDAIVIDHPSLVIVYGEVATGSLSRAGLRPGDVVKAGQVIGYGGRSSSGTMLHVETWQKGHAPAAFTPWPLGSAPPAGLLDPTLYFLSLSKKTSAASTPTPTGDRPLAQSRSSGNVGAMIATAIVTTATGLAITKAIR
jgi:murein DD-endopeptidase MepM/ murein hydrolase activator NlpD